MPQKILKMNHSIRRELEAHIADRISDRVLTNDNIDDWHFHCFNEDYYIIGYYQCSEWLKKHGIGEFEAAGICRQYEIDNFGESRVYDNSESVVNMLVYIWGQEILEDVDASDINELMEYLDMDKI